MMDAVNNVIVQISDVVWNYLLLFLLVGTGIFFTIRTRFVQVRRFKTAWMRVFGGFSLKGKKVLSRLWPQRLQPRWEPEISRAVRRPWCPAAREQSSGCGWLPFLEWRRSTVKPFSLRNPKREMRMEK